MTTAGKQDLKCRLFFFFLILKEVADFCTRRLWTAPWAVIFLNLKNHYCRNKELKVIVKFGCQ